MEYTELTVEEKIQILRQRQKNFELEHFQHEINRDVAKGSKALSPEARDAGVKQAVDAMAVLEEAHAATVAELKKLQPKGK